MFFLWQGEEFVKGQITRETKYEKFKMFYAIKIHLNKLKLKELKKSLPAEMIRKMTKMDDTEEVPNGVADIIIIEDDDENIDMNI